MVFSRGACLTQRATGAAAAMEDDLDAALALSLSKGEGLDEDEEMQRALFLSQQGSW